MPGKYDSFNNGVESGNKTAAKSQGDPLFLIAHNFQLLSLPAFRLTLPVNKYIFFSAADGLKIRW
jgi:hypothetical protein